MQVFIARSILNHLPSCWERAPECFTPTTRFPIKQQYIDELVELGLVCCDENYNDGVKMCVRTELGEDFYRLVREIGCHNQDIVGLRDPSLMAIPEDSELKDAVQLFVKIKNERAESYKEWYRNMLEIESSDDAYSVFQFEKLIKHKLDEIEQLLRMSNRASNCINTPNVSVNDFLVTDDEEE